MLLETERERKFLIDKFPLGLVLLHEEPVYQLYTHVSDEKEIRYRVKQSSSYCRREIKYGNGDTRECEPTDLPFNEFYNRQAAIGGYKPIYKAYRKYQLPSGLILEVSKVDDEWFYAEVEFETAEAMAAYIPEFNFTEEVTGDPAWQMKNYWLRTREGFKNVE